MTDANATTPCRICKSIGIECQCINEFDDPREIFDAYATAYERAENAQAELVTKRADWQQLFSANLLLVDDRNAALVRIQTLETVIEAAAIALGTFEASPSLQYTDRVKALLVRVSRDLMGALSTTDAQPQAQPTPIDMAKSTAVQRLRALIGDAVDQFGKDIDAEAAAFARAPLLLLSPQPDTRDERINELTTELGAAADQLEQASVIIAADPVLKGTAAMFEADALRARNVIGKGGAE